MDTNNIKENIKNYKEKAMNKIEDKKTKIKKIVIITVVSSIGIGVVGAGGAYAYLKSNMNYSEAQLKQVALKQVPGEVVSVKKDIDDDNLSLSYEFKIKDKNNMLNEVEVDSKTGAIIDIENHYNNENNHYNDLD